MDRREFIGLGTLAGLAAGGCVALPSGGGSARRWYKGMLHSHTYWSDGCAFPEQAVACYRDAGYDFLALTDHNRFAGSHDEWREVFPEAGNWPPKVSEATFADWKARFPWAETRQNAAGRTEARLATFAEMAARYDVPEKFLLLPGCEVTRGTGDTDDSRSLHMNYVNLPAVIPSARHSGLIQRIFWDHSVADLIRATREETALLAEHYGRPHLFVVNHPQSPYYDVLPQDLVDNPEVRFFEVCNNGSYFAPAKDWPCGSGMENERFWDVVNAFRARRGEPLLYGLGSDDTHYYVGGDLSMAECTPGDAWIRVRAEALTPEALFGAMVRGDFYATCGVEFDEVEFDGRTLRVVVPAQPGGETVKIEFIVTRRDFDDRIVRTIETPAIPKQSAKRTIPVYSDTIGVVAGMVEGRPGERVVGEYTLSDDDLYVRARAVASRESRYYFKRGKDYGRLRFAAGWTQPYSALR